MANYLKKKLRANFDDLNDTRERLVVIKDSYNGNK